MARRYLSRERQGHTLQTTALVHEAYMRLIDQKQANWQNRAHFFGLAAQMMRRILIDHARSHQADKRGGNAEHIALCDAPQMPVEKAAELIALDDALNDLAEQDAQMSKIVELRFFGGCDEKEVAELLKISERTVQRKWHMARAWLQRELSAEPKANQTDESK